MSKQEILNKLAEAIAEGDIDASLAASKEALAAGIDPLETVMEGASKGLDIVGERFKNLDAFLPDLMTAGEAMKACVALMTEEGGIGGGSSAGLGTIVIGTVFGDIHDIGKNLVATMLAAAGFKVVDMGLNVSVKNFLSKADEVDADIICMSALLTNTAHYMKLLIEHLKDASLRDKYYIMVGGSVVSPEWAEEIGADGYSRTAVGAAELAKELMAGKCGAPSSKTSVINY